MHVPFTSGSGGWASLCYQAMPSEWILKYAAMNPLRQMRPTLPNTNKWKSLNSNMLCHRLGSSSCFSVALLFPGSFSAPNESCPSRKTGRATCDASPTTISTKLPCAAIYFWPICVKPLVELNPEIRLLPIYTLYSLEYINVFKELLIGVICARLLPIRRCSDQAKFDMP